MLIANSNNVSSQNNVTKKQYNTNFSANINDINSFVNLTNPKSIWGAVVTLLHRNNLMALYTACGDIREISLENNELIINIHEEYLYSILTAEETFYKISSLLSQVSNNLTLKFVLVKQKQDNTEYNIKRLKQVFGNNLQIKN